MRLTKTITMMIVSGGLQFSQAAVAQIYTTFDNNLDYQGNQNTQNFVNSFSSNVYQQQVNQSIQYNTSVSTTIYNITGNTGAASSSYQTSTAVVQSTIATSNSIQQNQAISGSTIVSIQTQTVPIIDNFFQRLPTRLPYMNPNLVSEGYQRMYADQGVADVAAASVAGIVITDTELWDAIIQEGQQREAEAAQRMQELSDLYEEAVRGMDDGLGFRQWLPEGSQRDPNDPACYGFSQCWPYLGRSENIEDYRTDIPIEPPTGTPRDMMFFRFDSPIYEHMVEGSGLYVLASRTDNPIVHGMAEVAPQIVSELQRTGEFVGRGFADRPIYEEIRRHFEEHVGTFALGEVVQNLATLQRQNDVIEVHVHAVDAAVLSAILP